jgi:hypothetical protein
MSDKLQRAVVDAALAYRNAVLSMQGTYNQREGYLEVTGKAADLNEKLLDAVDVLAAAGYEPTKGEPSSAMGTLLMLNDVPIAQLPEPKEGQGLWGIYDRSGKHVATIPCQVEGDTITVPSFDLPTSDTWLCSNHPPGSEIEVKKGEKCSVCGRIE